MDIKIISAVSLSNGTSKTLDNFHTNQNIAERFFFLFILHSFRCTQCFFRFLQFKAFRTYFLAMRMVFEHWTPFTYSSISANSNSVSGNNRNSHINQSHSAYGNKHFFVFLFFLLLLDLFFMLFDFNGKKQPVNLKLTLKNIPWKMGRRLFTEL